MLKFSPECFLDTVTAWNVLSYTSTRPLVKFAVYRKRLPLTKALVRPVKLDPSVVLTTVTASVEGGAAPWATATVGFQPAIVPSIVENKNAAGFPGASKKSV